MATRAELVYMVQDELKNLSDDQTFTFDHVAFLLGKYRAFLLKQRYADIKKQIPNSNYQTICLSVELTDATSICGDGIYLKSTEKIPFSLSIVQPIVSPIDFFGNQITYVNWSRFRFVGNNNFLKKFIYATIGPDNYLYLKSGSPQYMYLENVSISGVFENPDEAIKLSCEAKSGAQDCNEDNLQFPIEEALIPPMIQLVVQELTGGLYRPKDNQNNSSDDLSGVQVN
jgi:hypothetical protein